MNPILMTALLLLIFIIVVIRGSRPMIKVSGIILSKKMIRIQSSSGHYMDEVLVDMEVPHIEVKITSTYNSTCPEVIGTVHFVRTDIYSFIDTMKEGDNIDLYYERFFSPNGKLRESFMIVSLLKNDPYSKFF